MNKYTKMSKSNKFIDIVYKNCTYTIILYMKKDRIIPLLIDFDNKQKIVDVCGEHSLSIHEELIPYENKIGFNSEGFRGDEFSKEKSSDVYRIFIVGGSTILGAETSNETTIPAIVQKMFDKQNFNTKNLNSWYFFIYFFHLSIRDLRRASLALQTSALR